MGFEDLWQTLFGALVPISSFVIPHKSQAGDKTKGNFRLNLKLMSSNKFILHMTGAFLQSAGYLIPGYFMSSFGQTLAFTQSQGAIFIGVNNAFKAASKIIIGYFADRVGQLNMLVVCCTYTFLVVIELFLGHRLLDFLLSIMV